MTVLNVDSNSTKKVGLGYISSIYKTKGEVVEGSPTTEIAGDKIILGNFTHNTILKSLKLYVDVALTGAVFSLVFLDEKNEEIVDADGNVLDPIEDTITLSVDGAEMLDNSYKFSTLGELLTEAVKVDTYQQATKIALKITTAPTTPTADVKILSEIEFIEKY